MRFLTVDSSLECSDVTTKQHRETGVAIKIGLREANQKFSKVMKAVRAGRQVVLTERGEAIAVIRPLREGLEAEAAIERLRAQGFLRASTAPGPMPAWKPRPVRGEAVAVSVHKERNER